MDSSGLVEIHGNSQGYMRIHKTHENLWGFVENSWGSQVFTKIYRDCQEFVRIQRDSQGLVGFARIGMGLAWIYRQHYSVNSPLIFTVAIY